MATRKTDKKSAQHTAKTTHDSQLLTADDLQAAVKMSYEEVEIPFLSRDGRPGVVYVREPSAWDALDMSAKLGDKTTFSVALADLMSRLVTDREGNQLLSVDTVRSLPPEIFKPMSAVVMRKTLDLSDRVKEGNESSETAG